MGTVSGGLPMKEYWALSIHEDNKGYVPADLTDALVEAAEDLIDSLDKIIHPAFVGYTKIEAARAALAALKAMGES